MSERERERGGFRARCPRKGAKNNGSAKLLLVFCPTPCRIDSNVSIAAKVTRTSYKKNVARVAISGRTRPLN